MPKIDLSRTLPHARIAELPNPYFGKVRDCYDLPDGTRILVTTDRLSAFDQILAVIPWKGQVLTQLARYWFEKTQDIAANHVLSYPDPNVVLGKKLTILPVEIVVRGYLAGTTSTSILTQYKAGARRMYGHTLPDSLRDKACNETVFLAIVTPALSVDFLFARHLFCRYMCSVGVFQSLIWMKNRDALVVGFDRARAGACSA